MKLDGIRGLGSEIFKRMIDEPISKNSPELAKVKNTMDEVERITNAALAGDASVSYTVRSFQEEEGEMIQIDGEFDIPNEPWTLEGEEPITVSASMRPSQDNSHGGTIAFHMQTSQNPVGEMSGEKDYFSSIERVVQAHRAMLPDSMQERLGQSPHIKPDTADCTGETASL